MTELEYARARTIDEAVALLNEPGVRGRVLAGGTTLALQLRRQGPTWDRLVDITHVPDLLAIDLAGNWLSLGAAVTLTSLLDHTALVTAVPLLAEACRVAGAVQIRNRATLGGTVMNAAGCADLATVLVCLDAEALLASSHGTRRVPVANVLAEGIPPGELLCAFELDVPPEPARTAYLRVDRRRAIAGAQVSLAAIGQLDHDGRVADIRLVPGGVFEHPRRVPEVEGMLRGQPATETFGVAVGQRMRELFADRDEDRWSLPFKAHVVAALTERVLRRVLGGVG